MKTKELMLLGVTQEAAIKAAHNCVGNALAGGMKQNEVKSKIKSIIADPNTYIADTTFSEFANAMIIASQSAKAYVYRDEPASLNQWGSDLEESALTQIHNACKLPVSVAAALMPDAHTGYGLPIGGVLATDNAVIPYAVGVDIACRMKLSVLDLPVTTLKAERGRLVNALETETAFGVGAEFTKRQRRQHPVMDEDWSISKITSKIKDKAWAQLGTSGSGNHFVEFGILTLAKDDLNLKAGVYLALLSHSGSRGSGAEVASYYSNLAISLHPELPKELVHLAWLDLNTNEGKEYWKAMELMGKYAAANHQLIHKHIAQHLGVDVLLDIENHHNFAWKEIHNNREVIVHRKGATPAASGLLGIIPGSMATPGYVVRGLGKAQSLNSASHGAGRRMSRKKAMETYTWNDAKAFLAEHDVDLISAGLDEVPMAYKDIETVMAAQADLVQPVARFDPRLVKMAGAGEKPED